MVRDEQKVEEALRLRERGFTLEEIAKYCDVSKSTVSKWLKNNAMSAVITAQNKRRAGQENAKRLRLINKARGPEREARYQEARRSAETEFKHFIQSPLFVAGVTLYAVAGDLNNRSKIRFSSSDLATQKVFVRFAREYLGVTDDQIRCWLLLYANQSEEVCMKKWKTALGIPYSQFHKTQFVNQTPKQTLHYGIGNTIIGSTVLQAKLIRYVELLKKAL